MRRFSRFYPLLFAIIPPLHIAAANPGRTHLSDLVVVAGLLLVLFGLIFLLVAWACGPRRELAAITVMVIIAYFYSVGLAGLATPTISHVTIVLISLLGATAIVAWLHRHELTLHKLNDILALTGVLLVGLSAAQIGIAMFREHRFLRSSQLAKDLADPINLKRGDDPSRRGPTIYLILLDEYANAGVLTEQFGFANREFEDSLRRLGFTIPKLVRSNYAHTTLSLPSLLNFSQLSALTRDLGPKTTDPYLADYLLEHNRTVSFLKAQGYQFVLFPSGWWPATAHSPQADREFRVWHDFDPRHLLARTELGRHLWIHSLLRSLGSPDMVDPDYLKGTFEGLRRLDTHGKSTFVFAHVLLPHTPYVFDAECRSRTEPDERNRQLYLDQLQCTNKLVLNLVTTLLHRPGPLPVVLLQGDHGSSMLDFGSAPTADRVTAAQARERFGAFGAYFLPGGGGRTFGDTLTLVDVFPKVLDFYFGANLPMGPDDLYMSVARTPFDFARVDPRTLQQR